MRKMDEMEMSIQLRAVRCAWLYSVLFLVVWMLYDLIKWGDLRLPFILLTSQNLVLFGFVFYFRRKMGISGKDHDQQD
ncbi:MAG: hypothetical protein GX839_04200 [Fastidiosipila sp.]|nr:hypothetical protein [Fastidiosipila sp.]